MQFVWGPRYVDDLILRDRDATGGGDLGVSGSGLDERLYALTDALFNVVALINTSGAVQERFLYDPYGKSTCDSPPLSDSGGASKSRLYFRGGGVARFRGPEKRDRETASRESRNPLP